MNLAGKLARGTDQDVPRPRRGPGDSSDWVHCHGALSPMLYPLASASSARHGRTRGIAISLQRLMRLLRAGRGRRQVRLAAAQPALPQGIHHPLNE